MSFVLKVSRLKPWILPIAIAVGILFHKWIGFLAPLSAPLIFIMLLITYCRVSFRDFRVNGSMWWMLLIQVAGSIAIYAILRPLSVSLAESIFICVLCPTATAAPVITGILGGDVARVSVYSLIINIVVALLAPVLLAEFRGFADSSLLETSVNIGVKVFPLILGPLVLSVLMYLFVPKVRHAIASHQGLSFYIWAFSLIIVVGNATSMLMSEPVSALPMIALIAVLSLAVCLAQFAIGRRIGACYGDPVAGAQSLGQKNTVLAIWLAITYMGPIASVGPACYIAWHNLVNSWQIYRRQRCQSDEGDKLTTDA